MFKYDVEENHMLQGSEEFKNNKDNDENYNSPDRHDSNTVSRKKKILYLLRFDNCSFILEEKLVFEKITLFKDTDGKTYKKKDLDIWKDNIVITTHKGSIFEHKKDFVKKLKKDLEKKREDIETSFEKLDWLIDDLWSEEYLFEELKNAKI